MFDLKVREHKRKMRKEAKQKAKSKSQCSAVHFASLDFIILSCMHAHTHPCFPRDQERPRNS